MSYEKIVKPPHKCDLPVCHSEIGRGSVWRCDECGDRWLMVGHVDGTWERIEPLEFDDLWPVMEPGGRPSWVKSTLVRARAPWRRS